jgi:hypothetical protein
MSLPRGTERHDERAPAAVLVPVAVDELVDAFAVQQLSFRWRARGQVVGMDQLQVRECAALFLEVAEMSVIGATHALEIPSPLEIDEQVDRRVEELVELGSARSRPAKSRRMATSASPRHTRRARCRR